MKIGVIGGNGVAATNLLCQMIEEKMTRAGAYRDAHHPEMIIWQATSAPSRSMFLEGRGPTWIPDYVHIASEFKRLGCNIGCMCCNTAHYAVDEIQDKSQLKFINLLEEVAHKAKSLGLRKIEMFCSDGARKFDIYGDAFKEICPEIELHYPDKLRQAEVTKVICGVKSKARFEGEPHAILTRIIAEAQAPVILGCTDLRIALPVDEKIPDGVVIDSLECLADKIVTLSHD